MGCISSRNSAYKGAHDPTEHQKQVLVKPKLYSGFISKEGQKYKSWKKRFFILDNGIVSYYTEDPKDKAKSPLQKGEPLNLRGYKMVEYKDNVKLLTLEHKLDRESRVLNLEHDSSDDKEKWKLNFKLHIEYLDALYAEQVSQQAQALEKPRCINSMTIWMKTNAPHVITSKAQEYATKLYDNKCTSIETLASKIVEKKTYLLELGVERDDNDDILAGLVKPKMDPFKALLTGPNMLGKYSLVTSEPVPTTVSQVSSSNKTTVAAQVPVEQPPAPSSAKYSVNR